MPEQTEYLDKYLEARFKHIDDSVFRIEKSIGETTSRIEQHISEITSRIEQHISEIKTEVKEENETTRREVKAENKATRWWTMGTAVTVLLGLAAILLTFVQIQNSWMQQVISFVGKAIVK